MIRHHFFDGLEHFFGLLERRSCGRPVIKDKGAFVHGGHQTGFDPLDQWDRRRLARFLLLEKVWNTGVQHEAHAQGRHRPTQRQPRKAQGDGKHRVIDVLEKVIDRSRRRHRLAGQEPGCENRNQRQADHHRYQHRDRQCPAQRGEELAINANDERQGHEHEHSGQGRADHGAGDFTGSSVNRVGNRGPQGGLAIGRGTGWLRNLFWTVVPWVLRTGYRVVNTPWLGRAPRRRQMPGNILNYHHRIVDDQADRHRQPAERHQVEGRPAPVQEEEGDRQRRGDGEGRDQRRPPAAQERQQDEHAEQAADDDGVAHILNRGVDEAGLVIDHRGGDPLGHVDLLQERFEVGRNGHRVAAQPAEDRDDHGILALVADRLDAVGVADLDVGHVAQQHRLVILAGDHQLLELPGLLALRIHDHLVGERLMLDPADGHEAKGLADALGKIGRRKAVLQEILGPGLDLDLAQITAGHVCIKHIGHVALDLRRQPVIGVVAEV